MDLDPFVAIGIEPQTLRFLDVFLMHCLTSDSPPDTPQEIAALGRNQHRTAARGREPGLQLERDGGEVALSDWGAELMAEFVPVATALDQANGNTLYSQALQSARAALDEPDSLPSARVLAAMTRDHDNSFVAFARQRSLLARQKLLTMACDDATLEQFQAMAGKSLEDQKTIELADTMPFEIYREQYLSPKRLGHGLPMPA